MSVDITIDPEFEALVQPLSAQEFDLLTEQILRDGIRDSLTVWKTDDGRRILLDGHNRHKIYKNCSDHDYDIPSFGYTTLEIKLDSREHAKLWILEHQVGRRNLTDDQRACAWNEIREQRSKVASEQGAAKARAAKAAKTDSAKSTESEPPTKTWIDFSPHFMDSGKAKSYLDFINTQSLKPETGACNAPPTHDSIQWGPRQAYVRCVPAQFRIASSGSIPAELAELHHEIEQKYQAVFNTIQVNRHYNEKSIVQPHSDNMHGDIVMLSLGAPRRFVLRHKHDDKSQQCRWKAGDIYFDKILPSGSLLTIYKAHQFDLTHEMPAADEPCEARVSLIWRYIAQTVTKKLGRHGLIDGTSEYNDAQATFVKDSESEPPTPKCDTRAETAKEGKVSESKLRDAQVLKKAAPEAYKQVQAGAVSMSAAKKLTPTIKKPKNPKIVAAIQAHEKSKNELAALLKESGIDAEVRCSSKTGKFNITWHDVTAEQAHLFAETFKVTDSFAPYAAALENVQ